VGALTICVPEMVAVKPLPCIKMALSMSLGAELGMTWEIVSKSGFKDAAIALCATLERVDPIKANKRINTSKEDRDTNTTVIMRLFIWHSPLSIPDKDTHQRPSSRKNPEELRRIDT
jgi:hypothetical protein